MRNHEVPGRDSSLRKRTPRWAVYLMLLVVALLYPVMACVVPWLLSSLTPRFGWTENDPATGNLLGLIPIAIGVAGLIWVFSAMLAKVSDLPEFVELEWTSQILMTHGPFAISRNPMFVSGVTLFLGWSIFYGSLLILGVSIVLWLWTNAVKVPREERALEARFGDAFRDYKQSVPRWL
ncbi:MAG: isoprenylcysteine carboxylmethyltransferase family protein [Planctomycetes bacterium]|nr:isoprenylcysteine carboxylmethyltransferase family protein [Planctomycetota bacterium]